MISLVGCFWLNVDWCRLDQLAKPTFRSRYVHTPQLILKQVVSIGHSEGPMDIVSSRCRLPVADPSTVKKTTHKVSIIVQGNKQTDPVSLPNTVPDD